MSSPPLESMIDVLQALFVAIKTVAGHGPDHPFTLKICTKLEQEVQVSAPPWKLQFIKGGIFRDLRLLDLGVEGYHRLSPLGKALARQSKHEIQLERAPTALEWITIAGALQRAMLNADADLDELEIPGLSFHTIANAGFGDNEEELDPEIYAIGQIALAMDLMESIEPEPEQWPWQRAMTLLRYMDRAISSDLHAATRALELAPQGWDAMRCAASAAFHVMASLKDLGVDGATARVAAHAALILCVYGYTHPTPISMHEIAPKALERASQSVEVLMREVLPPHPLKVLTTLRSVFETSPDKWMGFLHLILMSYDLEQERIPTDVAFNLTRGDLMVVATQNMGTRFAPSWVKLLVNLYGATPPGSYVRTPSGALGVVLDTKAEHVRVLIEGQIQTFGASQPLTLVSSMEALGIHV